MRVYLQIEDHLVLAVASELGGVGGMEHQVGLKGGRGALSGKHG